MRTIKLFFLLAPAFFACTGLQAQVSIGSTIDEPATGALLDLNTPNGNKGGLLLSNVSIADLSKIPRGTNLFPGIIDRNDDTNTAFTGAMVYHTGENNIPAGIYIWNGGRWVPPGGDDPNILYDAEMNDYTTGDFGTAGIWMTQNLRTAEKYYADINENLTLNDAASTTKPYYTYPRPAGVTGSDIDTAFYAHEDYGLLYNWVAASGRINVSDDERNTDHARHQGICPTGWHLPSDKEWYQLETEIAGSAAGVYSTTGPVSTTSTLTGWRGEHGGKMKSTIPVNNQDSKGTSHSRESNGFDALLVGGSDGASYGLSISFWASSSGNSNDASYRVLRNSDAQVNVGNYAKTAPRSVRCKKDD